MKRCSKCGETKPLSEYYKRKIGKDGHRGVCKSCCGNLYQYPYTPNVEQARENKKRHYLIHKERISIRAKKWREDNKDILKIKKAKYQKEHPLTYEKSRNKQLKKYGITLNQYNEMFMKQNGLCAICGCDNSEITFHVDHNHTTGKVRQILCSNCNQGIGHLKESPSILQRAITYLQEHV